MSMIIERCARLLRFLCAAALVLAAWFVLLLSATLWLEPVRTVAVFAPRAAAMHALASSEALLVDAGTGFIVLRGQSEGFVARLYAGGAWLVLPARGGGCGSRFQGSGFRSARSS